MGYFVWYACMSFPMKALAAAALEPHLSGIMVMLYEVTSWLCYGYIIVRLWLLLQLLRQPGKRLCYGCHAPQERKNVSAVPMAPGVSFQPLNSCLGTLG